MYPRHALPVSDFISGSYTDYWELTFGRYKIEIGNTIIGMQTGSYACLRKVMLLARGGRPGWWEQIGRYFVTSYLF